MGSLMDESCRHPMVLWWLNFLLQNQWKCSHELRLQVDYGCMHASMIPWLKIQCGSSGIVAACGRDSMAESYL